MNPRRQVTHERSTQTHTNVADTRTPNDSRSTRQATICRNDDLPTCFKSPPLQTEHLQGIPTDRYSHAVDGLRILCPGTVFQGRRTKKGPGQFPLSAGNRHREDTDGQNHVDTLSPPRQVPAQNLPLLREAFLNTSSTRLRVANSGSTKLARDQNLLDPCEARQFSEATTSQLQRCGRQDMAPLGHEEVHAPRSVLGGRHMGRAPVPRLVLQVLDDWTHPFTASVRVASPHDQLWVQLNTVLSVPAIMGSGNQ